MLRFIRQALRVLVVPGVAVVLLLIGLRLAARLRETQSNLQAAPSTGRFITAADIDMYVQELGPAGGPAVLFISGLGAWSETWRPTMSALAAAGYRSIAIDLPPFGYSFRPRDASYGTDAQAQRVVAALDALHVRDVVLVGHSFGGRATVEAALRLPGRVRALVLVDAALGLQSSDERTGGASAFVLDHGGLRNTLVAATATNPWLTYRFLSSFTAKHDALTDERVAIYQRPLTQTGRRRPMAVGCANSWRQASGCAAETGAPMPRSTCPRCCCGAIGTR